MITLWLTECVFPLQNIRAQEILDSPEVTESKVSSTASEVPTTVNGTPEARLNSIGKDDVSDDSLYDRDRRRIIAVGMRDDGKKETTDAVHNNAAIGVWRAAGD